MAASMICWASSGFQLAMASSLTMLTLPSRTLWAPALNSEALLSFGDPLIQTTLALVLPSAVSFARSAVPCSSPTFSLSNEM